MTGGKRSIVKLTVVVTIAGALILTGCENMRLAPPKGRPGKSDKSVREARPEDNRTETITETPDSTDTFSPSIETPITTNTASTDTVADESEPSLENTETTASAVSTTTPQRTLRLGLRGEDVKYLQERLTSLNYSPGAVDGYFSMQTRHAIIAFQKVSGLSRDGVAGPKTLQALENPKGISAKYSGSHVEVSKAHQVLLVVKDSKVEKIISASTGRRGYSTPSVKSAVDWKAGYLYESKKYGGTMVWSSFFYGGIAVHGFSSVPAFPASHGCVRVPISDSKYVYDNMPIGSMVYVY